MIFFRLRHLIAAWLAALTLTGAVFAEELVIPGSGNPEYVLTQLAKAFNQRQNQHTVTIPTSTGTAGALRDVEVGTASLGRVGRPLKEDERKKGIVYVALGRDPVVFAAIRSCLRREQVSRHAISRRRRPWMSTAAS